MPDKNLQSEAFIKKWADLQVLTHHNKIHQKSKRLTILFCFFLNNIFFHFLCNKTALSLSYP